MNETLEREFNDVYESFSKMLFGIIYSYLKEKTITEDILQEVFISYLEKSPNLKTKDEIKYWLIRVSINKSLNEIKKRNKTTGIKDDYFISMSDDLDENDKKIILNEIYSLPEKLKIVTILFYFEEMKINEISKALKVKESAVKMRLKNARDILKERLKDFYD